MLPPQILKIKKNTSRHAATTSLTVHAVCNGTFNAAAFDGNPFLLFWGGGESSGWLARLKIKKQI